MWNVRLFQILKLFMSRIHIHMQSRNTMRSKSILTILPKSTQRRISFGVSSWHWSQFKRRSSYCRQPTLTSSRSRLTKPKWFVSCLRSCRLFGTRTTSQVSFKCSYFRTTRPNTSSSQGENDKTKRWGWLSRWTSKRETSARFIQWKKISRRRFRLAKLRVHVEPNIWSTITSIHEQESEEEWYS